jgi:hypothetical protein
MKRKLPIGIQDFISIREDGYVYVDKTARIHDLVSGSGRYFFLSRPRRFGKSLLCSTLGALFEGRRELFGGIAGRPPLAIDSVEWDWGKHPGIRLDLNPENYTEEAGILKALLQNALSNIASNAGLRQRGVSPPDQFVNLIQDMYRDFGEKEELERDFADEITAVLETKHTDRQSYLDEVKRFYNGYRFSAKPETVYNTYGLLNHFNDEGKFNSYWFSTGTPTFLATLIEKQKIDVLSLEKLPLSSISFQNFNVDTMDALAVLYQSGYLTITDYSEEFNEYILGYPNEEVRAPFANALLALYAKAPFTDLNSLSVALISSSRISPNCGSKCVLIEIAPNSAVPLAIGRRAFCRCIYSQVS